MNNVICEADIRRKKSPLLIIWYIIMGIVFIIGAIPAKYTDYYDEFYIVTKLKRCWFIEYGWKEYSERGKLTDASTYGTELLLVIGITIVVFVIPLVIKAIHKSYERNSNLVLKLDGVEGNRKKLFSTANLHLPMDKLDSIMQSSSIFNKIWGGKTVGIRSTSGLVKFPYVQNADEFVEKTLAQIEEYKKSVATNQTVVSNVPQNATSNQTIVGKITDLKNLLDQGVLTQEEFDRKKQELLDKM